MIRDGSAQTLSLVLVTLAPGGGGISVCCGYHIRISALNVSQRKHLREYDQMLSAKNAGISANVVV